MIFENLVVNNFGVYSGKQNFELTTDKKKPVILIGAMNGSGKTTFLQAIDFVLYGKFSNIFTRSLIYSYTTRGQVTRFGLASRHTRHRFGTERVSSRSLMPFTPSPWAPK